MTWRYSKAGKELCRPDSELGLHVEGPLTVEDWKVILQDIIEEMIAQAQREASSDHS